MPCLPPWVPAFAGTNGVCCTDHFFNPGIVSFSAHLSRRAGALPRGTSRRASVQIVGFEPFAPPTEGSGAPKFAGAESAAPIGLPYGIASPVSGRDCRSITRTGAPLGAPLRRFSFVLETASGNGQGPPLRKALDSAWFFALRSSAPTSPLPDGPT